MNIEMNYSLFMAAFSFLQFVQFTFGRNDIIELPNGLKEGDLIEWKGRVSAQRIPSKLVLTRPLGKRMFSVTKLEIQGARNRLAVGSGYRGKESFNHPCLLGNELIAPNKKFWLILRILSNKIHFYWNSDLKYTLPLRSPVAIAGIRNARLYGTHQTERFRLLTNETMAEIMESGDCGFVTQGKSVPTFCNRPNGTASCRIVGGEPAIPGLQPWQASIRKKPQYVNFGAQSHICGATLIGNCWAITAEHCFLSKSRNSWSRLVVRVGDYYNEDNSPYSRDMNSERSQDIDIAYIYRHSDYVHDGSPRNDIALIRLSQCIQTFNDFVRPACLPRSINQFGSDIKCGISGWGASNLTQHITEYPKCLQTATVNLINNAKCQRAHEERNFDPDVMLCAGNRCVDACLGDSGGPLICSNVKGRKFTLWGITSWGIGCGDPEKPGVYTRVAKYIPWMFRKMFMVEDEAVQARINSGTIRRSYCQHRSG